MIRFRLAKINIEQFAILAEKVPTEGLSYTVNLGFKGASNAKCLACVFTVEFAHNEKPLLKLSISCEFEIHADDWNQCLSNNILTISKNDLGFFANQTVGTARGIMFCKTEGTEFSNFILPPINLTEIIQEDLVLEFAENDR